MYKRDTNTVKRVQWKKERERGEVIVFSRKREKEREVHSGLIRNIVNTVMCTKTTFTAHRADAKVREREREYESQNNFPSQCSSRSRKIKKSSKRVCFYFILLLCLCFSRSLACPLAQSDSCCVPQPSEIYLPSVWKVVLLSLERQVEFFHTVVCTYNYFFLLSPLSPVRFLNCKSLPN